MYVGNHIRRGRGRIKHGMGAFYCDDDNLYVGGYADGKFHGKGIIFNLNKIYIGNLVSGSRTDYGLFNNLNYSATYEGGFKNDEKHGPGSLIRDDILIEGTYKNSKLLKEGVLMYSYPRASKTSKDSEEALICPRLDMGVILSAENHACN